MSVKEMTAFGGKSNSVNGEGSVSKGNESKTRPVFGIDLGTTNSAISVIYRGEAAETIQLTTGKFTMPSCVMWKNGKVIVGKEAYNHRDESCTVYSVKSLMQDVNARVTVKDGDNEFVKTPAEVSSLILKGLVEETGGMFGEIKDVVVTVPAYFDQNGINATREACTLAGLNLIGIANEPTAASLCYGLKPSDGGVKDVIIYDLGGGTFDVTLMRISDTDGKVASALADLYGMSEGGKASHSVTTLGISGDTHLGGDNVDRAMLRILYDKLREQGVNPAEFTRECRERLILRLEELKKRNVTDSVYTFDVDTVDMTGKHVQCSVELTPADFRDAMRSVYLKTREIMTELLGRVPNNADSIVLVGGSTKNPWLWKFLQDDYPSMKLDNALNPDLSVANGAAIQGKVMKFGSDEVHIFDILPLTIGIADDGKITPLVKQGTQLPVVYKKEFTTVQDGQESVEVRLFQGNSMFKEECVSLGVLRIDGIAPKPAGEPTLYVTLSITADRLLKCHATVDGIEKEIMLNLAGESTSARKLSKSEKQVLRWRKVASQFSNNARYKIEKLLDEYERTGSASVKEQIVAEIRKNREKIERA